MLSHFFSEKKNKRKMELFNNKQKYYNITFIIFSYILNNSKLTRKLTLLFFCLATKKWIKYFFLLKDKKIEYTFIVYSTSSFL